MEFQRLRLAGFKSFVDAADLRIEPGLTGVVGPNGCGKSNLLEAFRWVMGEGSPKSLRGGGMDDVIFAGTARRPGRDFAEVMLTLGDAAGAMSEGDETLQIVRRIERGLGSAYRVNGRDVRARDVALLFADAATGAHSPALVSQGRIGAIVAAKPAERRLLLEEAAGIAGLHARRHEAELRLKATEANLLRLDDVIAGQTAAAAALRRAAKAAERYRALSAALQEAEQSLMLARWTMAQAATAAAETAAAAADAAVDLATRAAACTAAAQAAAAAGLPSLRDDEAAAAAAAAALTAAARALEAEAAMVERRRAEVAAASVAVARDRAREATLADDAAAALAALTAEAAALDKAQQASAAALPAADAAAAAAERDAATTEAALAAAIEAHAAAAAAARTAAAALETGTARRARTAAEADRLTAQPTPHLPALAARCDDAAAAVEAGIAAVAVAAAAIAEADAARLRAGAVREAAATEVQQRRGELTVMTAERESLARLLARGGAGAGLLDSITVTPGDERALAAAFGDDLTAAIGATDGRWWAASDGPVPPLPAGTRPLRASVPPELARRLAATGVAEPDEAEAIAARLLPGQRAVTVDGRLWRWDGFRAFGGSGAASAERLTNGNRLNALIAILPRLEAAASAAAADLRQATAAVAAATAAELDGRAVRAEAERDLAAARAEAVAAAHARDRAAVAAEALAASVQRLRHEVASHDRDIATARAHHAAASGLAGLAAAATDARRTAEAMRASLAVARAAAAALRRDGDGATLRLARVAAEQVEWRRRSAASAAQTAELDRRAEALAEEAAQLAVQLPRIATKRTGLAAQSALAAANAIAAADARAALETKLGALDRSARDAVEGLAAAREARARAALAAEHAASGRRDIEAACGARFNTSPPALSARAGDAGALTVEVARLAAARDAVGPVNLRADLELDELTATMAAAAAERAELDAAVARLRGSIGSLNREGRKRLLAAFEVVDGHFRELFGTLFAGGAAHLELVQTDDVLAAGLEIMAQPPGKKLQSLSLLSGGEQALVATALIFALFLATPSPLCVLDEVDAPLDDANVDRFCALLDHMAATTATRFLIVTHNAVTMSRMHRLYGVTMAEPGVSQLVSVDLGGAGRLLAAE